MQINPASPRPRRAPVLNRVGPSTDNLRWSVRILWLVAGLAVGQLTSLLFWYWPGSLPDTHTSGVWIALAHDVAHGDLYRPLLSELGTGGTRYLPLFFTAAGGLIGLGVEPLAANVGLTLASAAALMLALVWLQRQLAVPAPIAWPVALLMLGTVTWQMMTLTVKGDFLAAACNLGGVAAALNWRAAGGRAHLLLAAFLFAAAFLTKVTTVFGLGAVALWWLQRREWRPAVTLVASSGALMLAGLALAGWASEGRMLESFRAVASGDTDGRFAVTAPLRFAIEILRDPLGVILLGGGLIGAVLLRRPDDPVLPRWLAGTTLGITLIIFASPGTGANHLIDPLAVAALLLGVALARADTPRRWAGLVPALLGLGLVISWLPGVPSVRQFFTHHHKPERAAVEEFMARAGPAARPMFAENPLLPILVGERPFVADLFNLELMMRRDRGLHDAILGRLRAGTFGSLVLSNWPAVFPRDVDHPDDPAIGALWPALQARGRVSPEFYAALQSRYRIVLVRRPYIYLLRDDLPFAPP